MRMKRFSSLNNALRISSLQITRIRLQTHGSQKSLRDFKMFRGFGKRWQNEQILARAFSTVAPVEN